MKQLISAVVVLALASAPAFALERKGEGKPDPAFAKQYHSWYCTGTAACNACEVYHQGKFLGHCALKNQSNPGEACRCASSEGWMKGTVMVLDPVKGWLYAD